MLAVRTSCHSTQDVSKPARLPLRASASLSGTFATTVTTRACTAATAATMLSGSRRVAASEARRAMEERLDEPWTVESLARCVGLSRAALARRFAQEVGEPPLTYLTRWRLAVAADLVLGTDLTLASIAVKVGYANAFALSAAFKRVQGESPRDFRHRHRHAA